MDLVIRVCQAGLTTAARLRAELATRPRQRWRSLLLDLLADVADGVQSPLERRYLQRVERAHGLPRGERNHQEGGPGTHLYRDVRYRQYCLLIELDGLEAHPGRHAHRDRRRDNRSARDEHTTLRYGWHEVTGEPCDVAVEVAEVLAARGWTDPPRRCGPGCTIPRDWPTTAS